MASVDDDAQTLRGPAPKGVQSVDRAISVLELLAQAGDAGVSDIATAIGVHKSTAFRLLSALEARELVEQNDARGKYRLSHGILRLASAVPIQYDITRQAQPVCDELAASIGETVNLAVVRSGYSINLCQSLGPSAVGSQNWLGELTPLHATASGKVLLAYLDPTQVASVIDGAKLKRLTEHTVVDPIQLRSQLAAIARNGYAYTFEELEDGLNAVSAPIRNHTGSVIAAVSASGPVYRFSRRRMAEVTAAVIGAATKIGYRMGYSNSSR